MKNIESFNIAVAEAFGQCYQAFPLRIDLSVIELGKAIQETIHPDCSNDIDMRSTEYAIARESVNWLIESGYLWHRNATSMTFNAVTLSPKGLEILNAVPKGIEVKTTLGEELGRGVKEIGKEAALDFVKATLTYGASLVLGA
ncbi:hypothetical protein [uncultured Amphritea sp.]|uniref:hypothetical protein n=1 Tax=uncultured Amphritea sp. TaxID=981605 RepID=UPI0025E9A0BD|nr:hypothetical protein [uncultured Amphritea sp.]